MGVPGFGFRVSGFLILEIKFIYFNSRIQVVKHISGLKSCIHIKYLLLFFILAIRPGFIQVVQGQTGDEDTDSLFYFTARIIDRQVNDPVQFAHVINQSRGFASISDSMGYFKIGAALNDLLKLTAIGYYDCPFHLNEAALNDSGMVTIYMIQRAYPIQVVNINPLGTYSQFKQKVLSLELPEPVLVINPSVIEDIEMGIDTIQNLEPASLGSPITAIYMALSREGKELRKYAEIMEEEQFLEQVKDKYNHKMLEEVTGLTGPELYHFLQFCNLERKYILEATAYEILEAIHKCLEEYKK